ncbi:MAG TPA: hypothetical protein V6C89_21885 [Drouetiella sp.]
MEARAVASTGSAAVSQTNNDMRDSAYIFAYKCGDRDSLTIDCGSMDSLYGNTQLLAQAAPERIQAPIAAGERKHYAHGQNDIAGRLKEWLWNDAGNDIANALQASANAVSAFGKGINDGIASVSKSAHDTFEKTTKSIEITASNAQKAVYEGGAEAVVRSFETGNRITHGVDLKTCAAAAKTFGLDKLGVDNDVIAAIVWNEQLHLKPTDGVQDAMASLGMQQRPFESIGPGQIQIQNLEALAQRYPMLRVLGDDARKAAVDPLTAPYFVAAYLANEAHAIAAYNEQHPNQKAIPITAETLAYRYNADVYSNDKGELRSLSYWEKAHIGDVHGWHKVNFPTAGVTEASHHVQKVMSAFTEVKKMPHAK